MIVERDRYVSVARFEDLQGKGCITVHPNGKTLALFLYGDKVYALDNRCPHMGFPLDKGSVEDGILSCHWHHARFDLASGGAFDLWADDIDSFPVEVRNGEIFVDLRSEGNTVDHQRNRLRDGLQHNLSLVVAKAVINLLGHKVAPAEPFRIGLHFGALYRGMDWGRGLTTLGCAINLVPWLDEDDRPLALFHGLSDVASDTAGMSPRFNPRPLPNDETDVATLKEWFRQFVEVRDAQAGERAIVSALRAGANDVQIADMLFTAATDHRYLDAGHTLDFINKALTSVDLAGWEHAELAFTSVVPNLTDARRMEESNAWRKPIDLIPLLEAAFAELPAALEAGSGREPNYEVERLMPTLLGDEPQPTIDLLLNCLRDGIEPVDLAGIIAYAAARRIAEPLVSELSDPHADPAAAALCYYRQTFRDRSLDDAIRVQFERFAPSSSRPLAMVFPEQVRRRDAGVGRRKDMIHWAEWHEDGTTRPTREPCTAALTLAYRMTGDAGHAARALDTAARKLAMARRVLRGGREHADMGGAVCSVAAGHGRNGRVYDVCQCVP
jgi:nitrite reductase/ring-hydroxylating ferredoxin subunit